MKLANFFLVTVLVGTLGVLGCGDDTTNTAGSGGDGTAGTGGEGGTGGAFDFDTACDRELCAESDVLKMECEAIADACRTEPPENQDECIILITEKCDGG